MRDDKLWRNWPQTRAAIEHALNNVPKNDYDFEPPPPSASHSLLSDMAAKSGGAMREIRPGMWYVSKLGRTPPVS